MLNIINTVLIFLLKEVLKCKRSFSGIEKHFNDYFVYKHTLHDLSTHPQKKLINKKNLFQKKLKKKSGQCCRCADISSCGVIRIAGEFGSAGQ